MTASCGDSGGQEFGGVLGDGSHLVAERGQDRVAPLAGGGGDRDRRGTVVGRQPVAIALPVGGFVVDDQDDMDAFSHFGPPLGH